VELGRLLFFDKVLSGNRNISCATCHHPRFGTSDGLSLGIGEGGHGVGIDRIPGTGQARIKKRVPRNSLGLWNLGAVDQTILMHDGRISEADTYENGFNTPAEEWLPAGFNDLLAVQAIFPLIAQFEMAGNLNENEVIGAVHDRVDYAWPIIEERVRQIQGYRSLFVESFAHIEHPSEISIVDIGNAIGAFVNHQWRSYDSPFDDYVKGNRDALTDKQMRGLALFFGEGQCANCHSGKWFTDNQFYALGLPAFGPGRTRRYNDIARDLGRMAESDALDDIYRFRTPPLRNVELTSPYGHNGAFKTLEGIIRHHLNPHLSRSSWSISQAVLPEIREFKKVDLIIQNDRLEMERYTQKLDIEPVNLGEDDIDALTAFLRSLTGRSALAPSMIIPDEVPSGLKVDK
jgi:cytochrome c peroxidase